MSLAQRAYFLTPKFWPLWLAYILIYPIIYLPWHFQQGLGRSLGKLLYYLAPYRRHIAKTNLSLCFTHLDPQQQQQLLKRYFACQGIGIVETVVAWWAPEKIFSPQVSYSGLQYLQNALDNHKGVLLLSGHFTTMEIGGRLLAKKIPFHPVYRKNKNALLEQATAQARSRRAVGQSIDRKNTRAILKALKQGRAIWYGADQDYGPKHSVFTPFFGVLAATLTATQRWARASHAQVVPFFTERTAQGYHVKVFPPLEDFPSNDAVLDASRVNQIIENQIKLSPENYLWAHRRFKTRPKGEPHLY